MTKRMWMAVVSLLGLFLGLYLTLFHYGYIGSLACGVGSCERVQTSKWSVLFGIPLSLWGMGFYALMLVLAIAGVQEKYAESSGLSLAMFLLSCWGVLFTAWLDYLQGWVIHGWCEYCLTSGALILILFVLTLLDWRETRRYEAEPIEA